MRLSWFLSIMHTEKDDWFYSTDFKLMLTQRDVTLIRRHLGLDKIGVIEVDEK